jgi:hypothetical protein
MELMASSLGITYTFIVVGKGSELVNLDETIQRNGSARGTFQFDRRTVRLHVESFPKILDATADLPGRDLSAQICEFVHLQHFDVAPKISALLSQVGIDVKHSPVIVTHHSEAVVFHRVGDSACIYPRGNLIPSEWVVLKDSGDLEKRDAATTKYIGDFRHGTSLTIGQPFAGHSGSVTHAIEGLVIDCRGG